MKKRKTPTLGMTTGMKELLKETAEKHGVPEGFILGTRKYGDYVNARHEFFYNSVRDGNTASSVARRTGFDSHTVQYACARYALVNDFPKLVGYNLKERLRKQAVAATAREKEKVHG